MAKIPKHCLGQGTSVGAVLSARRGGRGQAAKAGLACKGIRNNRHVEVISMSLYHQQQRWLEKWLFSFGQQLLPGKAAETWHPHPDRSSEPWALPRAHAPRAEVAAKIRGTRLHAPVPDQEREEEEEEEAGTTREGEGKGKPGHSASDLPHTRLRDSFELEDGAGRSCTPPAAGESPRRQFPPTGFLAELAEEGARLRVQRKMLGEGGRRPIPHTSLERGLALVGERRILAASRLGDSLRGSSSPERRAGHMIKKEKKKGRGVTCDVFIKEDYRFNA
ncbi:uncharacterized protein LOC123241702 [Gracilinanus agilis]|uniref:uncharacterized protein LOC123241702 n=1 Tax=Gracilinanus agilis TaxID=191870 RepID=UPI001CFE23C8|nr:uncharacterized protein LOC123241702 [Gracilinanus agilis]